MKVFHVMEPEMSCEDVSINVTVTGKLEYTGETEYSSILL